MATSEPRRVIVPVIIERVTLQDVRHSGAEKIYYSVHTCWWTHDAADLCRKPSGVPCDPRGGVLMQTSDPSAFLDCAEAHQDHYGKHGLRAFVAAHNANCRVSHDDDRPTCMRGWQAYNDALDALINK